MSTSQFLSDFIMKQFDNRKFKEMIRVFLNIVDNFQMVIDKEEYYIKITPSYEMRVGGSRKPTNSKIESFLITKYDTIE